MNRGSLRIVWNPDEIPRAFVNDVECNVVLDKINRVAIVQLPAEVMDADKVIVRVTREQTPTS